MYMGLDLGTSSLKAIIIDEHQKVICEASQDLTVSRPKAGYSEQNPQDWLNAVDTVLQQLKTTDPDIMANIAAIGFSGQMHGLTLIDSQGEPLRPAILWNDGRSAQECTELAQKEPQFLTLGGNLLMPGFTAPKLEWVRKHEPEIFAKIHQILLPKDYVRFYLTGDFVSEMSDAAGTLWLDVQKRSWSEPLLAASQITKDQLPRLIEGCEISGYLKAELAQRWGMSDDVIIAGGAGDNAAAACGLGAVKPSDAFISLGTSGVIFACSDDFQSSPETAVHSFCHAIPGVWHQMGVFLAATDCVNWISEFTGQSIETLMGKLGTIEDGPSSLLFLPYLSGERTPYNDADARASLIGLSRSHKGEDVARAILEGVAFAVYDNVKALEAAGTTMGDTLMLVGGGSRNHLWVQIIATLLGRTIELPEGAHLGAAFGAARLAMAAADHSDVFVKPAIAQQFAPCLAVQDAYRKKFNHFKSIHHILKETYA